MAVATHWARALSSATGVLAGVPLGVRDCAAWGGRDTPMGQRCCTGGHGAHGQITSRAVLVYLAQAVVGQRLRGAESEASSGGLATLRSHLANFSKDHASDATLNFKAGTAFFRSCTPGQGHGIAALLGCKGAAVGEVKLAEVVGHSGLGHEPR